MCAQVLPEHSPAFIGDFCDLLPVPSFGPSYTARHSYSHQQVRSTRPGLKHSVTGSSYNEARTATSARLRPPVIPSGNGGGPARRTASPRPIGGGGATSRPPSSPRSTPGSPRASGGSFSRDPLSSPSPLGQRPPWLERQNSSRAR